MCKKIILYGYISIIIYLLLLSSCVPAILVAPSPKMSIEKSLPQSLISNPDTSYLVVPIWEKAPFVYYNEHQQETKILADDGFLISKDKIPELHEILSRKIVIGMGSIFGNIGRDIKLKGVVIFPTNGDAVFVPTMSMVSKGGSTFERAWGKARNIHVEELYQVRLNAMIESRTVDKVFIKQLFDQDMIRLQLEWFY